MQKISANVIYLSDKPDQYLYNISFAAKVEDAATQKYYYKIKHHNKKNLKIINLVLRRITYLTNQMDLVESLHFAIWRVFAAVARPYDRPCQ